MWNFMSPTNYEQYTISKDIIGDNAKWLKEQDVCIVTLWNNNAIGVTPPIFAILKVVETDPGMRGDTATGGSKPATLETNAQVMVPLFVNTGDKIKVETEKGTYKERIKE
jgi:elongation factor P